MNSNNNVGQSDFEDRVVLITGAGSGIGREITKKLHELGAKVIAVAQTQSKLDSLKEECGGKITTVSVNLADWIETRRILEPHCKDVDYLINNAGYAYCERADSFPKNELDKILDINLKAPINLIQLVATGMKERKFGSIVNVSSVASIAAVDDHIAYAASKAALDMVTRCCAKEFGPYNVRVNSVNPTVVWTKMGQEVWGEPSRKATIISKIPMGRFVEVREVVGPILFLLSNQSSMISGTTMPIDGGYTAS